MCTSLPKISILILQKLVQILQIKSKNILWIYEGYIEKSNSIQPEHPLNINELKDAFPSLDINKSPDFDGISFTVLKNYFGAFHKPLLHVFNLSLVKGIFLDDLKITRVTPVVKGGDEKDLGNYRPISVLPCFSKILKRTMYNRLYNLLIKNNILYSKQFGFQKGHSTEHAIIQFIDQ